jgi:hypothetical protein
MSFPYALLQFEAEQAKQRLTQMFHAAAGLCGENLLRHSNKGIAVIHQKKNRLTDVMPPGTNLTSRQNVPIYDLAAKTQIATCARSPAVRPHRSG